MIKVMRLLLEEESVVVIALLSSTFTVVFVLFFGVIPTTLNGRTQNKGPCAGLPDLQAALHRKPQIGKDGCLHPVTNLIVLQKKLNPLSL